jgi:hypothetical protein
MHVKAIWRRSCIRCIWVRIKTSGRLFWRRYWTLRFHKMRGIPWPAEKPLASQEGLHSVTYLKTYQVRVVRRPPRLNQTILRRSGSCCPIKGSFTPAEGPEGWIIQLGHYKTSLTSCTAIYRPHGALLSDVSNTVQLSGLFNDLYRVDQSRLILGYFGAWGESPQWPPLLKGMNFKKTRSHSLNFLSFASIT